MQSSKLRIAVSAGAVMSLLGCGPSMLSDDADAVVAARGDAIVGGTLAAGDPAVVVLAVTSGGQLEEYCSGTLVGPKTVLTAAHCINAYGSGKSYVVGFGPNVGALTKTIPVAQQVRNPSYNGNAWDFGILRLSLPATGITPIPLNDTALTTANVGQAIRHVGFGITNASGVGSGVKREVTYNLRQVARYTIESGASGKQTCSGDSGGPAFMVLPGDTQEKLVGVVSYGDQSCVIEGWDGRVDVAVNWIRTTMGAWETPTCALDGACVPGCTPVDQDCACAADGQCTTECADLLSDPDCPRDCARNNVCAQADCPTPDPDCVAEGALCSAAQQCRERLCVSDSQHPDTYCSKSCTAPADCPATMECASGTCRFPIKPERQLFEPCSPAGDFCVGSICTGPVGGITRCVASCTVTTDCPAGSVCEAGTDSRRYCRPADLKFTPTILSAANSLSVPAANGCTSVDAGLPSLWLLALAFPTLRRRRASK